MAPGNSGLASKFDVSSAPHRRCAAPRRKTLRAFGRRTIWSRGSTALPASPNVGARADVGTPASIQVKCFRPWDVAHPSIAISEFYVAGNRLSNSSLIIVSSPRSVFMSARRSWLCVSAAIACDWKASRCFSQILNSSIFSSWFAIIDFGMSKSPKRMPARNWAQVYFDAGAFVIHYA